MGRSTVPQDPLVDGRADEHAGEPGESGRHRATLPQDREAGVKEGDAERTSLADAHLGAVPASCRCRI
jgi:hypothetical protein